MLAHQGRNPGGRRRFLSMDEWVLIAVLLLALCTAAAMAQSMPTSTQSVVDSATLGPVAGAPPQPVVDASAEASPVMPVTRGLSLAPNAEIAVVLKQGADSGQSRNGDMVRAVLGAPVKVSDGRVLPAGTPVGLTVLAVAAAGKFQSQGELTLQVTRVGPVGAISDAQTFFGKEGKKELADSAPEKGTEGGVAAGTVVKFKVPALVVTLAVPVVKP